MSALKELDIEANEAFYKWEVIAGKSNLSDKDREIWVCGYIVARLLAERGGA
jgi:hypothetical protein